MTSLADKIIDRREKECRAIAIKCEKECRAIDKRCEKECRAIDKRSEKECRAIDKRSEKNCVAILKKGEKERRAIDNKDEKEFIKSCRETQRQITIINEKMALLEKSLDNTRMIIVSGGDSVGVSDDDSDVGF